MNRLAAINGQFSQENKTLISKETISVDGKTYPEIIDYHPDREIKINYFRLRGWGYQDSGFEYDKEAKMIKIKGNRYMFGGQYLPKFGEFVKNHLNISLEQEDPEQ